MKEYFKFNKTSLWLERKVFPSINNLSKVFIKLTISIDVKVRISEFRTSFNELKNTDKIYHYDIC